MKTKMYILISILVFVSRLCSSEIDDLYARLSNASAVEFNVKKYLNLVIRLQEIDKDDAINHLKNWSKDENDKIIVLCRMLFVGKNGEFRRPALGGAVYLGDDKIKYPLEPIIIENGVPFYIVSGYVLGGEPESPSAYLKYCVNECQWNNFKFSQPKDEEINTEEKSVIEKLKITSPEFMENLNSQIK